MGAHAPQDYGAGMITRPQAGAHNRAIAELCDPRWCRRGDFERGKREDGTRRVAYASYDALIYTVLTEHHNWGTGRCDPSPETIAPKVGRCPNSVRAGLRRLCAEGWIDIRYTVVVTPAGARFRASYTLWGERRYNGQQAKADILAFKTPRLYPGCPSYDDLVMSEMFPADDDEDFNETEHVFQPSAAKVLAEPRFVLPPLPEKSTVACSNFAPNLIQLIKSTTLYTDAVVLGYSPSADEWENGRRQLAALQALDAARACKSG